MAATDNTSQQLQAPTSEQGDVEVTCEREPDAPAVEELDAETRERRDAALAHIRKLGDPVLRASAVPVQRFDDALATEIDQMGELMQDALGIGLAATQLGVLHRVLVYRAYADDPVTALVNPVLEWASEELEAAEEGCLSLPGVHVEVERPARVRVRAQDRGGEELKVQAEGLEARVIQHEIDHLDGVLILDRISREARKEAMRAMRQAQDGAGASDKAASSASDGASSASDGASSASDGASSASDGASSASDGASSASDSAGAADSASDSARGAA
jgi:peptide deformylase